MLGIKIGAPLATESPSLTNKRGTTPKKLSGFKANVFEGLALVKNFSSFTSQINICTSFDADAIRHKMKFLKSSTNLLQKASPLKVNN